MNTRRWHEYDNAADFIKFAAVVTAAPRWIIALMAADGFTIPASWAWVHIVSGVFGGAMTVLEGVAVAYVLAGLARTKGKQAVILAALTTAMLVSFIVVLAPSIFSRVTVAGIAQVLASNNLWLWAVCVPASTILTVAAVGYAQATQGAHSVAEYVRIAVERVRYEAQASAEAMRVELDKAHSANDDLLAWAQELQDKCAALEVEAQGSASLADVSAELAQTRASLADTLAELAQANASVGAYQTQRAALVAALPFACTHDGCGYRAEMQQGLAAHMRHRHSGNGSGA